MNTRPKGPHIAIGANEREVTVSIGGIGVVKDEDMNEREREAMGIIREMLADTAFADHIWAERRCDDYLSIIYGHRQNVAMRMKFGPRSIWVSFRMYKPMAERLQDDPRFDMQKNKKQSYWKAVLGGPADIMEYEDVVRDACLGFPLLEGYEPEPIPEYSRTIRVEPPEPQPAPSQPVEAPAQPKPAKKHDAGLIGCISAIAGFGLLVGFLFTRCS